MKSFKAFIKSWYYFLKEEKWVARTFMVIVVLIVLFINNITESLFYYNHDVLEYGAIKKYSLSFNIIAQKLYNRLEDEISADPNVTGLRAFLYDDDELSYRCDYSDDTMGERIIMPLTHTEKQSAKNINNIFSSEERYLAVIIVWENMVIFAPTTYYEIRWFPDKRSLNELRSIINDNYGLRRVHPLFTNLYIFYEKRYGERM